MPSIDDLRNLKTLPESYKWKPTTSSNDRESIPVIDLADSDVVTRIGNACETWGAFQIANHGIPSKLLDDVESLSSSLFGLPTEQKLETATQKNGIGGYGEARIAPFFDSKMWSEGFTIVAGSYRQHFPTLWPHDYDKYCGIIEEYEEEMQKLAGKLMGLILGSIGVTEEDIKWTGPNNSGLGSGSGAIRLNHYPVCPEPDQAMGLAAHTDSTMVTILHQNNAAGLQMFKEGTGWVLVKPVPGLLVVNVGDLLHILSNGKLRSSLHQALVNKNKSRFSIAYLWGPSGDIDISPISKLVSPIEPAMYRPVTWKEYLEMKARHFDKALSMIKASPLTD
ncbi:PREDICTED: gibberellin 3-beta-dioxygenase 4 [Tarenaya hassleriana]|uniref:gibberellin 3-beta-dioxygenase 4 n=1 Tax=Tarenaya hassleriana TaxID=28532 RepID=UPI00053C9FF6|nr:PREDICTED: gibberellin 3-beta-dioxygenase 4 [Tarenaya hassleriana]